ncbi:MAG: hypothetical protein A2831_01590 [Candidatus Yanofskybacteria bacterium RIFCSPHIGHO2_01_FULL_44_17]|uniref:Uncharacterized protein n=1 Tax=Candidatus Yanofskybacteria bacterium RIFCSPHIGHO2_01_FULL_44_17 TaxID=1802668 RepID=A0A1F8EX12_9BACT|nr:MAG: hypothetical protein A2831_01590 [Candidatus Yanofskybacteria bacterium RIFCSPHIGHO2_01_FULL_44_17]
MPECVEPNARWARCHVCSKKIKTCGKNHSDLGPKCPEHPAGRQLKDGRWICSGVCLTLGTRPPIEPHWDIKD